MTASEFLKRADDLPLADLAALARGRGIVVVAPHPDDESLGCGGLIADAVARNIPVAVVVVSDGVGSHPASLAYPAERLRGVREAETLAAVAELGLPPDRVRFLRLPDRHVPSEGPEAERAADAIADAAVAVDAGTLTVTWRHDPHCDHAAAYAIARLAAARSPDTRLYEYPVWGWSLPPDREVGPAPSGFRLAFPRHRDRKRRAIGAHLSQTSALIDDDPSGFRLSREMIARFVAGDEIALAMPPDGVQAR